MGSVPTRYRARRPQDEALYRVLADHLETFLAQRVLPDVPVRQRVLSLPFSIRYVLAYDAELCREVRAVFVGAVQSWVRRRARDRGTPAGQTGAVTFTQRFDSALRLNAKAAATAAGARRVILPVASRSGEATGRSSRNLHFHTLVLDGVFTDLAIGQRPRFVPLGPPTTADIEHLCRSIRHRILRCLRKHGRYLDDEDADADCPYQEPGATRPAPAVPATPMIVPESTRSAYRLVSNRRPGCRRVRYAARP